MKIEEKELRILVGAREDLAFSFQQIEAVGSEDKPNQGYALIITTSGKIKQNYVLYTTISKEVRRFKDLRIAQRFIQKLKPNITGFNVIIDPTFKIHSE